MCLYLHLHFCCMCWCCIRYIFLYSLQACFCFVLRTTAAKKNQVSQANKLKRDERLSEIDDLLQNNKELQEQIMQKLDEARALNATTEVWNPPYLLSKVHWFSVHDTTGCKIAPNATKFFTLATKF